MVLDHVVFIDALRSLCGGDNVSLGLGLASGKDLLNDAMISLDVPSHLNLWTFILIWPPFIKKSL